MRYRFGDFTLDVQDGRLSGPDGPLLLRRQAWKLLLELLEHAPALLERDRLLDRVWGRQALSPNALPQTISELRQALGDDARKPRYIETCHGRGYRMVCEVERLDPAPPPSSPVDSFVAGPGRRWLPLTLGLALGLVVLSLTLWPGARQDTVPGQAVDPASIELLKRQAAAARQRHDPAAVAAQLRALSLLEPGEAGLMLDLAEAELDALQTEQARQTLDLLATRPAVRQEPRWLVLTARLAEIDSDSVQAITLAEAGLNQALALNDPEQIADAAILLSRLLERQADAAAALAVLDDARLALAEQPAVQARVDLVAVASLRGRGQLEQARERLDAVALDQLPEALRQRSIVEKAMLDSLDGQPDAAWAQLQALLQALPGNAHPDLVIDLNNALGAVGVEVGAFDQALEAFERAMALARRSGRGQRVAGIQVNAGALMARRDRFVEAERLWQGALEVFELLGDRRGEAVVLGNLAAMASAQGLNERSWVLNERALTLFAELGLDGPHARTAFNLALVAAREGSLDQAEQLFAQAWDAYRRIGQIDLLLYVGASRVDYRLLAGDLLSAEALLMELEELLDRGSALRRAAVHASAARLALWQGDLERSRQAFEQARDLRLESGQDAWVATSELELLQLDLLAAVDPWTVRVAASELAERFERRGQTRAAARSRLLMAEALLSVGETDQAVSELAQLRQDAMRFADASLALDLDWVKAWAVSEPERLPRLEALARRAREQGFLGKLAQIEAGLATRGLAAQIEPYRLSDAEPGNNLVVVLPPYASPP